MCFENLLVIQYSRIGFFNSFWSNKTILISETLMMKLFSELEWRVFKNAVDCYSMKQDYVAMKMMNILKAFYFRSAPKFLQLKAF